VLASGLSSAARASASGLPPGLTIDDVSGLISGTPTEDGSFEVFVAIVDGNNTALQTLELTFTSDPAIPVIVSPSTAPLAPGQFFSYTIVAPATTDPNDHTVFSIVGTLPAGLGLDPTTGVISGTPTARMERIPNFTPLFKALSDTPVVGAVQLVASNSQGTATQPLNFLQPAPNPLANISTRMQVQTGANVMIGGFIVSGMEPKKVVIRALGPTLANFGVPNVLANPTIELHDGALWRDGEKLAAGEMLEASEIELRMEDARRTIGFDVEAFQLGDELSDPCGVFGGNGHAHKARVLSAGDGLVAGETLVQHGDDAGRRGEIGLADLEPYRALGREGGCSAFDRRAARRAPDGRVVYRLTAAALAGGGRADGSVENAGDDLVRHRIGLETAQRARGIDRLEHIDGHGCCRSLKSRA